MNVQKRESARLREYHFIGEHSERRQMTYQELKEYDYSDEEVYEIILGL